MKKIIWTLSALGLALGMTACGGDGPVTQYCDHGTKTGCINGEWIECVFEDDNTRGTIQAHLSIEIEGSTFICNSNDKLVPDCTCKDGKLVDNNDSSIVNDVICTTDGNIYSCNGDEIVTNNGAFCDNGKPMTCQNGTLQEIVCSDNGEIYACDDNNNLTKSFAYCNDNNTVKCENGQLKEDACPEDRVCETYERSGSTYASCFKKEDVKTGCADNLKPYGSCAENVLTFCTNSDPKLGKTIELKCGDKGQTCMLVEEANYGYDCVYECKNENNEPFTDRGYCDGTTLHWCEPSEGGYTYQKVDCAENANVSTDDKYYNKTSCGFTTDFFDCQ